MVMDMGLGKQAVKVYRLLSRAYLQPPDCPYLEALDTWIGGLLAQRKSLPQGIVAALELIQNALGSGADVESQLQEIQQEHVRLFRGLSPRSSPPPPYESVYREGALWGSSTAAILRRYREFGLEPDGDFRREPPDHLGLELQFMACLCEREARGAQRDLLEEHLAQWFGMLRERVLSYTPHQFYEGILRLTEEWLDLHREYLAVR